VLNKLSTTPWRCIREWRYSSIVLDLGTRWRWVVSFTPRPLHPRGKSSLCPLHRRLGAAQSLSEGYGDEKNLASTGNRTPAVQPVTIATELLEEWCRNRPESGPTPWLLDGGDGDDELELIWGLRRKPRKPSSQVLSRRDNSVGIASGWTVGVHFPAGQQIFLFFTAFRPALGPTQPPVQWVPGSLPGGKAAWATDSPVKWTDTIDILVWCTRSVCVKQCPA
jgi:hypothetical protein